MTLGQRISEYRKKLGISQEELGARLGVSRQAVSKWETDIASPDMENLLALSREFGISVAELTATPEETAPEPSAPEPSPTGKGFPWKGLCFALLACVLVLGALWWNARKNVEHLPSSSAQEEPESPQTDFALLFDWMEPPQFLELGEQQGDYPFGVDLFLQGPDTVARKNRGQWQEETSSSKQTLPCSLTGWRPEFLELGEQQAGASPAWTFSSRGRIPWSPGTMAKPSTPWGI